MQMFTVGPTTEAKLDRCVPESLHAQISDSIRATIASGEWPRNYRLKAEPDFAKELGVSRGTLRRALATLIEEGLLKQVPGRGTFVTETLIEQAGVQRLSTLSEDFASQGVTLNTSVIEVSLITPPPSIARLMGLSNGQKVMRLVRVRSTVAKPIALLHNYVRTDLAPGIEECDFTQSSLFGVLENDYKLKIATARRTFSAQAANQQVATALALMPGSPVQFLEQLTFLADARAIEYSDVWIDSGALRVVTLLARR